jgi:hypothetical protein
VQGNNPANPYCMAFTRNGTENMFSSELSAQIVNYAKMSSTLMALMKVSQN